MRAVFCSLILAVLQAQLYAQTVQPEADNAKAVFEKEVAVIRSNGVEATQQAEFEKVRTRYEQALRTLMKDLADAERIDEALAVRDIARAVVDMKQSDVVVVEEVIATVSSPSGNRPGRLRGFGRKAGMKPYTAMFDLSPLQQYEDYVDIAGDLNGLTFLRQNGDVLDHEGKIVGKGAVKIFPSGFLDKEGVYHSLAAKSVSLDVQPVMLSDGFAKRRLTVNPGGDLFASGEDYEKGLRKVPERARKGVRKIALFWETDNVLTANGDLIRWGKKGEIKVPETIQSGIATFSISRSNSAFVLTKSNDLLTLSGKPHGLWPGKAKNIITGGLMWAVLDMEDRWHVFFNQDKEPLGNEVETLEAVMNRSETIDVQFYLRNPGSKNPSRSSYALWIEDVGAPELNLEDVKELTGKPAGPKKPGVGFFGIPIE